MWVGGLGKLHGKVFYLESDQYLELNTQLWDAFNSNDSEEKRDAYAKAKFGKSLDELRESVAKEGIEVIENPWK